MIIIIIIIIMIMIMFSYDLPWITIIQLTIVRTMAIFFLFHLFFVFLFFFSVLGRKPYSGLGGIEIVDFLKSGKRLQQPDGCSDEM